MSLTVLSVGYPLAVVSPDSSGGAEQVLSMLDRAVMVAGHRSIVVAPHGSRVEGRLWPTRQVVGSFDEAARAEAQARHRVAIDAVLARHRVDLVHLHGIDFPAYMPPEGVPVLATLHLPPDWYPAEALRPTRPDTWIHGVSATQHARCPPGPALLPPIPNGIPVEDLQARHAKRGFALFVGRICPEKGVHLAIEAAKRAEVPLLIAGEVYPYEAHQHYFDTQVRPALDRRRRFIGPVGFRRKRRLMSAARCLLAPFLAEETSSLVTREAIACGTPVIAFPRGALAEAIDQGVTGFLVENAEEMAQAIPHCAGLDPRICRAIARRKFSESRMAEAYLSLYRRLARPVG